MQNEKLCVLKTLSISFPVLLAPSPHLPALVKHPIHREVSGRVSSKSFCFYLLPAAVQHKDKQDAIIEEIQVPYQMSSFPNWTYLAPPWPSIPKAGSLQPSRCSCWRTRGAHQEHSSMLHPATSPAQLCVGHTSAPANKNTTQCNPPAFSTQFLWHLLGRREASAQWKQHHS